MFVPQNPAQASALRQVLSRREAALYLQVSERTLERWALEGGGPAFVRLGTRRVGYTIETLNTWLRTRSFATTSAETVKGQDAA